MDGEGSWDFVTPGIPDDFFWRGDIPMTKQEIRALALSRLKLKERHHLLDVGAGSGSISVEAALLLKKGRVYAVEQKEEAVDLINKNARLFNLSNIHIIHGSAPAVLEKLGNVDRIFIGGTGGRMEELLKACYEILVEDGIIVLNFILLESLSNSLSLLKQYGFVDIDLISVGISRGETLGANTMLRPLNPVFIISARKGESRA